MIPTSQMRKLKHKEVKDLVEGHGVKAGLKFREPEPQVHTLK